MPRTTAATAAQIKTAATCTKSMPLTSAKAKVESLRDWTGPAGVCSTMRPPQTPHGARACDAVADKTSGPAAQSVPHFSQMVGMFKVDA